MSGIIISIIASSLITLLVSYIFYKLQISPNKIIHFSINSYDVGKGLHNVFPKFQLYYDGKAISNEVQILRGGFSNIGRKTISGLENNSDIKIILPEGCKLKDIKIGKTSEDFKVKPSSNNSAPNIIGFDINKKFLSGWSFEYSAIIETTEEIENLHHKLKFKHSIDDTSEIENEYYANRDANAAKRARRISRFGACLYGIPGLLLLILPFALKYFNNPFHSNYSFFVGGAMFLITGSFLAYEGFYNKRHLFRFLEQLEKNNCN